MKDNMLELALWKAELKAEKDEFFSLTANNRRWEGFYDSVDEMLDRREDRILLLEKHLEKALQIIEELKNV